MHEGCDIEADFERWSRAVHWSWEEVSYLVAGLDPWKVQQIDPDVQVDLKDDQRKAVRDALQFHFRFEDRPERVSPKLAVEVLQRTCISVPSGLTTAVAQNSLGDEVQCSASDPASARKLAKLSKFVLAIAVKKYEYTPDAQRQNAVTRMCADAEEIGIKLDPETLRARLREARDDLNENEEFRLQEFLRSGLR